MLSREALNSALPLTEVLDTRGFAVIPVPGTPLEALVKATRSDANFMTQTSEGFQPSLYDIEYIANAKDETLGGSPHDFAMDDVVEIARTAVRGHVTFARTVVAPAVEELVCKTAETLNEMTPSSLLGMEVVVWEAPAPLVNSALDTLVRRYSETPYDIPALAMKLPDLPVSDILPLLQSGAKGLDDDVAAWAAAKGESFFLNLWEHVFQIKQAELNERQSRTFRDFIEDREQGWDYALGIFLLARRLADEVLPGTSMSESAYTSLMVEFRNQAGAKLCRVLDELDQIDKNQILVRTHTDTTTIVNGTVYRAWIEAGGDNEVLFGNLLTLPAKVSVEQINAEAAALKAAWQRHAMLTATVESNRRFERIKEILLRHFESQMRSISEGEEATLANRETVLKLFREQVAQMRTDDMADLWTLCLKLVCRSRFFRTDAERILSGIERVKRENPNIDVREAAAVSVIEYIGYWVSSQLKVIPAA